MTFVKIKSCEGFIVSLSGSTKSSTFPSCLKSVHVTLSHKKGKNNKKDNYRPASVSPTLPKWFEKCMFSQTSAHFDKIFSKNRYGFRKGYSI